MRLSASLLYCYLILVSASASAKSTGDDSIGHLFGHPVSESSRVKGPVAFPMPGDVIFVTSRIQCLIGSVLGTGSNSKVFEAECGPKKEVVAIKYQFSSKLLLQKDWEMLSMMNGVKGFPRAYYLSPVGRFKNTPFQYLIMEIAGVSLRSYARTLLPSRELLRLTRQVLRLLKKVHAKGYFFGDVHLENIMVKDGRAHLLDFGRSKPYISSNGTLIPEGAPKLLSRGRNILYLSPGELDRGVLSRRDDLFRLAECAVRLSPGGEAYSAKLRSHASSPRELYTYKMSTNIEELLQDVHPIIQSLYEYSRNLDFYDTPRYDFF